ncbi:GNAT family N-acetyltransferase [Streptomyces daliensis]|uniref:N-acetyltransferase n=1 Tax=Streptomyces daliensis TaxID=299421 RepID=A0A8T4J6E3_9ACTN|nr:N-acetyltransferase [Streptomyces daliensis]
MADVAEVLVRGGVEGDLGALTDIYNHYVRETPITFDIEPFTPEERRPWLLSHLEDGPHRLMVALETGTSRVLGYATSSQFRPKPAYDTSVEVSVYLAPDAGDRGLGTLLYKHLFEALECQDLHRAFAGIVVPNEASVRLHRRFGFEHVGTLDGAGRKFGRFHDVHYYAKRL